MRPRENLPASIDRVVAAGLVSPSYTVDDAKSRVQRILQGDLTAWTELQTEIEPVILRIARRHKSLRNKQLADKPDDLADVRTAALERLAQKDFQNLRNFSERDANNENPESFESWLYGVVDYAIRDHLRKRFGRAPKVPSAQSGAVQPSKRDLQSRAGRLDDQPEHALLTAAGVTTRLTVAEVMAFVASAFTEQEAGAIRFYYLEGRAYEDIAQELALDDAKQAEQLIRRLNARLRYRFAEK